MADDSLHMSVAALVATVEGTTTRLEGIEARFEKIAERAERVDAAQAERMEQITLSMQKCQGELWPRGETEPSLRDRVISSESEITFVKRAGLAIGGLFTFIAVVLEVAQNFSSR